MDESDELLQPRPGEFVSCKFHREVAENGHPTDRQPKSDLPGEHRSAAALGFVRLDAQIHDQRDAGHDGQIFDVH